MNCGSYVLGNLKTLEVDTALSYPSSGGSESLSMRKGNLLREYNTRVCNQ